MFGRNNGDGPRQPPGDEANPEQPQQPQFRLPGLITWKVRRFDPNDDENPFESILVEAHGVTHTDSGDIVFSRFRVDPVTGPTPIPIRAFTSYYDYEVVAGFEVAESRIIH